MKNHIETRFLRSRNDPKINEHVCVCVLVCFSCLVWLVDFFRLRVVVWWSLASLGRILLDFWYQIIWRSFCLFGLDGL